MFVNAFRRVQKILKIFHINYFIDCNLDTGGTLNRAFVEFLSSKIAKKS